MIEFSDSYHLLGTTAEAVALLERSGARGAAIPGRGRWTAIVTHPLDGTRLEAANEGVLLHYRYGGDHGCWVRLFDGADAVGEIEQNWEQNTGSFDVASWLRAKACDVASAEVIVDLVTAPVEHDGKAHAVAKALALSHHANLSSTDYCLPDQLEDHAGDVVWVPERPDEGDPGDAVLDAMAAGRGPFGPRGEAGRALATEVRDALKRKH
jgi:hypothetical protein